jgi:acyl-CoA synthetase (AMP-forming)/AMP-acid ligase II
MQCSGAKGSSVRQKLGRAVATRGFVAHAERGADRVCLLWDDGQSRSYGQVAAATAEFAGSLVRAGLGPGDKVAVLSPNSPECVVAMLAIQEIGAVWLPINHRDSAGTLGDILDRFGCDAILAHPELADEAEKLGRNAPSIRLVHRLGDPVVPAAASRATATDPADRELAAIFTTGGTTGVPKGVAFTHERLAALVDTYAALQAGENDIYLAAAPLTHVGGRICLSVLGSGGAVVILPAFDPVAVLSAVERYRVTHVSVTSTMLYRLLDAPGRAGYDTSSLRRLGYGSSPTAVGRIRQALDAFGPVLSGGYGQTEAPMFISQLRPEDHLAGGQPAPDDRLRSVGRPTPACEVKILGEDDRELPPGEVGEIVVRGNFTMSGYYRDPEGTAARRVGGFQRTGDLGTFDADGYLTIVGRRSDLIITGGFNVYPAEVENALAALPGVREAAVFGLPDDDWGEAVTAVVSAHPGAALQADELRKAARAALGGVKMPKTIHVVDELPRNETGKILKRVLASRFGPRSVDSDRKGVVR